MKTIELKTTTEKVFTPAGEQEMQLSTFDLLKASINETPQAGFTVDEMMYRLKVRQLLEETNAKLQTATVPVSLQLEDADYSRLKELVKAMKWAFASQFIVDFVNSL